MNILLMLVPISVVLLGIAIWAFSWAVRRGQFDDLDTPALDILPDEPRPRAVPPSATGATGGGSDAASVDVVVRTNAAPGANDADDDAG
jgi:cbb3-type cytochrome oxidase maturation protein